jgi:hypothetical protein
VHARAELNEVKTGGWPLQRPALANLASEMKSMYALVQQLQRKCMVVTAREKQLNARVRCPSNPTAVCGAPARRVKKVTVQSWACCGTVASRLTGGSAARHCCAQEGELDLFEAALMRNHQSVEAKLMNKLILVGSYHSCIHTASSGQDAYVSLLRATRACVSYARLTRGRAQEGQSSGYSMEEIDCGELTDWVKRSAASGGPASIWRKPATPSMALDGTRPHPLRTRTTRETHTQASIRCDAFA